MNAFIVDKTPIDTFSKKGEKDSIKPDVDSSHHDCEVVLTMMSLVLCVITTPFSLFFCLKVVQEYERAVIFRLGRVSSGGAKGPGIFFIIPCIDEYWKVDMRTLTFDIPPQGLFLSISSSDKILNRKL